MCACGVVVCSESWEWRIFSRVVSISRGGSLGVTPCVLEDDRVLGLR